ncbi:hypothetical protein CTI12_AA601090 [Artemisia annua]|uniref:Uncharacterized protein n=1 Tax=Artemisia annua TaxID=35608 RepID=A0A2U1KHI6_ARTAN|nr:hypothetical protein CTI12_AA601090 [Artemisia annua]
MKYNPLNVKSWLRPLFAAAANQSLTSIPDGVKEGPKEILAAYIGANTVACISSLMILECMTDGFPYAKELKVSYFVCTWCLLRYKFFGTTKGAKTLNNHITYPRSVVVINTAAIRMLPFSISRTQPSFMYCHMNSYHCTSTTVSCFIPSVHGDW